MSNVRELVLPAAAITGASSLAAFALKSPIGATGGALFGGFTFIAFAGMATLATSIIPDERKFMQTALIVTGTALVAFGLMASALP